MRNITTTHAVTFEEALRNLAGCLTGTPATALPRSQEAIILYLARSIPSIDELEDAVAQKVVAQLAQSSSSSEAAAVSQDASETVTEAADTSSAAKRTRKSKTTK